MYVWEVVRRERNSKWDGKTGVVSMKGVEATEKKRPGPVAGVIWKPTGEGTESKRGTKTNSGT